MLGKRFRRTTSMSQLGPAHPVVTTSEEMQGMQSPNTTSSGPHHHKAARPLITQGKKLGHSVCDVDASMGDVSGGFDVSNQDQVVEEPRIDVLYGGGYASMGVKVVAGIDPSPPRAISDTIFGEGPLLKAHGVNPTVQVQFPPSARVPFQMGLWSTEHNVGGDPYVGHYSTSFGKLEDAAEPIISPVDFLDVCFFCKRRLRHERDIFIYRGDTAFCSEECRHRQILSDERRTSVLRGGNSSSKRGSRATSSETAVAA